MNQEIIKVPIKDIKPNPENPRVIKDDKFKKLVKSIKEFPEMLDIRPIVVNDNMVVLGGNMRLKALKEAGIDEVSIIKASSLTREQQKEFIIKDNVNFGDWNDEDLKNNWDLDELSAWGMDFENFDYLDGEDKKVSETYSRKIVPPVYEPMNELPEFNLMYDSNKFEELIEEIESSAVDKEIKEFLKLAATRHIVFNYQKIADYYANSDKEVQELMENSALVIIDFEKAIEKGFVNLSEEIANQFLEDYGDE